METISIGSEISSLSAKVQEAIAAPFLYIDELAEYNTKKVLTAFAKHRVSDSLFAGTTGYGYDDKGRTVLEDIYADVFGAERALVRIGLVNGTHALSCALRGALLPGQTLLSVTGAPYETLCNTIKGPYHGNLESYGIGYQQIDRAEDGALDFKAIEKQASDPTVRLVFMQRSRGYGLHDALSCEQIKQVCDIVHKVNKKAAIMVDNCYGEFCEKLEPTQVGADLIAGSLIKNPGGGLAPTGGYIAGRSDLVENAAQHMTAPGIGAECGSTLGHNRLLFQGFFMAPHTVAQALKTAVFGAALMEEMGFVVSPSAHAIRYDINQAIQFGSKEMLCAFCEGIQAGAPVDSFVTPEPWDMPGYSEQIIMAAGAFIQGSSIELSADGPMREPYICYMQGGLTYESGKLGIMLAAEAILRKRFAK